MKLEIVNISACGNAEQEFVLLAAIEDCNLGDFIMTDSSYERPGVLSNRIRHTYRFPEKQIEKGALIKLKTGIGQDIDEVNCEGKMLHLFHWNLKKAVWNDTGDRAFLFQIEQCQSLKVGL